MKSPPDEAFLKAIETFYNGCSYTLEVVSSTEVLIGWGCYGVHVNLVQGASAHVCDWLIAQIGNQSDLRVRLPVRPETIVELLKREPCPRCGMPYFRAHGEIWDYVRDEPARFPVNLDHLRHKVTH